MITNTLLIIATGIVVCLLFGFSFLPGRLYFAPIGVLDDY